MWGVSIDALDCGDRPCTTLQHAENDAAKVMKSIRRIVRAIDMRSKKVARDTGLTIPQIVILHAVKERGMVTTAALSKHADLSAATTVTILDKLESRGLVTRSAAPWTGASCTRR